ncbi:MAG: hypothetical protein M3P39_02725 [Actinomycetota bacterium]|nr:hypothetical protein [Actinomycetota bacterium]
MGTVAEERGLLGSEHDVRELGAVGAPPVACSRGPRAVKTPLSGQLAGEQAVR